MESTLGALLVAAVVIGFSHTAIGLDHTVPFVALGRARSWSLRRTLGWTALCGVAHVAASVLLGGVGIGLGIAVRDLELVDGARGSLAAWLLIAFGTVYAGWSFARGRRRQLAGVEGAPKSDAARSGAVTGWSLFIVFALGPCEPLVPLLFVPALKLGLAETTAVAATFGVTTIATMLCVVSAGYLGLSRVRCAALEHHAHTLAGIAVAGSGLAIQLFGI